MEKEWDHLDLVVLVDGKMVWTMTIDVVQAPHADVEITIPEVVNPYWLLTFACHIPRFLKNHFQQEGLFAPTLFAGIDTLSEMAKEWLDRTGTVNPD